MNTYTIPSTSVSQVKTEPPSFKSNALRRLKSKFRRFKLGSSQSGSSSIGAGLPTRSLQQEASKSSIFVDTDRKRRIVMIDAEIESLKREEQDLIGKLDEVIGLVTSMERVDEQRRDRENQESLLKTEEFRIFVSDLEREIEEFSDRKEKVKEQLKIAESLIALLKSQLKEVKCKRNDLRDSLDSHNDKLYYMSRKLHKGSEKYKRYLIELEEAMKARRNGDSALIETYRANEKRLRAALEERTLVRRSLEDRKGIRSIDEELLPGPSEQREKYENIRDSIQFSPVELVESDQKEDLERSDASST